MNWRCFSIYLCLVFEIDESILLQKPITGEIVTTKWKRDVDYWTTERLREALMNPLDLKDSDEDRVNLTRRKRDRPIWTNEDLRSSPPLDTEISPEILRGLGIEPNDITLLDNELSAKNLADINEYPFSNYGKLFIKSSGGGGHCSAAFIRERVLLTAAHCVRHANGRWFEHFQFYQRFNGIEDQGRIVAVEMPFIYSNYIDDDGGMELRLDYAFLTTAESNDVTSLTDDFSSLISADEDIYFAGYPADTESGSKLIWSSGRRNTDITALFHVPQNPLTQGSSGGAWLIQDSDGIYKVVGLASHGKPARGIPGVFSPFLTSDTSKLLAAAETSLVTGTFPGAPEEGSESNTEGNVPEPDNLPSGCDQNACRVRCKNSYTWTCTNGHENCQCTGSRRTGSNCDHQACVRRCGGSYSWQCNNGQETCTCRG